IPGVVKPVAAVCLCLFQLLSGWSVAGRQNTAVTADESRSLRLFTGRFIASKGYRGQQAQRGAPYPQSRADKACQKKPGHEPDHEKGHWSHSLFWHCRQGAVTAAFCRHRPAMSKMPL